MRWRLRSRIQKACELNPCSTAPPPSFTDSSYEDMFENGNYRRRRRMKRPYRAAGFGQRFDESFATSANYAGRSHFPAQPPYAPYPRYDSTGGPWMTTSGHLANYSTCSSVYQYPVAAPPSMAINTYGPLANNIGECVGGRLNLIQRADELEPTSFVPSCADLVSGSSTPPSNPRRYDFSPWDPCKCEFNWGD